MATLNDEIYDILRTDEQSAVAGSLGDLLGYNAITKPRSIYFRNPPEKPALPVISYFISSQVATDGSTQLNPRNLFFTLTAWGDNFEAILERVFDLLQKKKEISATDFSTKAVLFDNSGPELFDEDLKIYYRADIFRTIAVKI